MQVYGVASQTLMAKTKKKTQQQQQPQHTQQQQLQQWKKKGTHMDDYIHCLVFLTRYDLVYFY